MEQKINDWIVEMKTDIAVIKNDVANIKTTVGNLETFPEDCSHKRGVLYERINKAVITGYASVLGLCLAVIGYLIDKFIIR